MTYRIRVEKVNSAGEYPNERWSNSLIYEQSVEDLSLPAVIGAVNKFNIAPTAAEIAEGLKQGAAK